MLCPPGRVDRRARAPLRAGELVHPALELLPVLGQRAQGAPDRVVLAVDAVADLVAPGGGGGVVHAPSLRPGCAAAHPLIG